MLEYQLHYLETIFPWLEDFEEADPYKAHDCIYATENDLEHTEYDKLKSCCLLKNTPNFQLQRSINLPWTDTKKKKSDWIQEQSTKGMQAIYMKVKDIKLNIMVH